MNYLFVLLLFLGQSSQHKVQKTYSIIFRGDKAGELKSSRWEEDGATIFENQSLVNIKMLTTLEVRYRQRAVFDGQGLKVANYTLWINDKMHKSSVVKREGSVYRATINGNKHIISSPITYSSSCLMLTEPNQNQLVFSEQLAEFHTVVEVAPNQFKKTASDGKVNSYRYTSDGVLKYAKLDGGLMNFELKLQ